MMTLLLVFLSIVSGSHIRIAPADEPGQRLVLTGHVVDAHGRPAPNVEIYAYHTDAQGLYRRDRYVPDWPSRPPRLQGTLRTAADGSYEIDTIVPAPYPSRNNPAHIHFHVRGQAEILWFEGDPLLRYATQRPPGDGTFASVRPLVRDKQGVAHCTRDFRLKDAR